MVMIGVELSASSSCCGLSISPNLIAAMLVTRMEPVISSIAWIADSRAEPLMGGQYLGTQKRGYADAQNPNQFQRDMPLSAFIEL
jgi:hypothetical protein